MRKTGKSQLALFFAAAVCVAAATGVFESIFPNYLDDVFNMKAAGRGALEFPRELPGFLVVLTSGALALYSVTRVGAIGALVFAAGLMGLALAGPTYATMVLMLMIASTGQHLLMPVTSSIAIGLSRPENRGRRMGQMGAVATAGTLLGCGFVWLTFGGDARAHFSFGFLCAAGLACAGALVYGVMHVPHLHRPRARLVFRRKYRLYYLLEFLFGARKQIFITFGPWVLVKVYGLKPASLAGLFIVAAVLGLAFKPLMGAAIDRFGERAVLVADGLVLAVVCLGYGYADVLTADRGRALLITKGCFVADSLLFALGSGRAVYLSRLTDSHREINSTLAMGVSINHVVSMGIPVVAGLVWSHFGYGRVFAGAAVLALGISFASSFVPGADKRGGGAPEGK